MKNMDELRRKYWKGTSEAEEEKLLKKQAAKGKDGDVEDEFFTYLESKKAEKMNAPDFDAEILQAINKQTATKRSFLHNINWRIAAAIVLLLSMGALLVNKQISSKDNSASSDQLVMLDTYDDPQLAYEETKKALLLISGKLNKGQAYAAELKKFKQTQENLKKLN